MSMAKKADFTREEWEVLRTAPHYVSLAVATAGASGPFGSIKEAFAPAMAIVEATKGGNELLRGICDREELKAAQQSLRSAIKAKDINALRDELQRLAADSARTATSVLQEKGSVGDADAYRTCLVGIAESTAKAAKEGGFLGFGGEWVSKDEQAVLNRISEAVGAGT
jgi:hypothetical protein